ncbi:MAG: hypothetical protein ABGW69_00910 [Nanoarchaeota archaeon]
MIKKLKKSNVVSFSIFIVILIAITVKYLSLKLEAEKYKKIYENNIDYIKQLDNNCFYVKEAYIFHSYETNNTILYIKLPKYILPLDKMSRYIANSEGIYLIKVVKKAYLDNIELNQNNFLITNSLICVET